MFWCHGDMLPQCDGSGTLNKHHVLLVPSPRARCGVVEEFESFCHLRSSLDGLFYSLFIGVAPWASLVTLSSSSVIFSLKLSEQGHRLGLAMLARLSPRSGRCPHRYD